MGKAGEGGNGLVKIIDMRTKTGNKLSVAIKQLIVLNNQIDVVENEVMFHSLAQDSQYVP